MYQWLMNEKTGLYGLSQVASSTDFPAPVTCMSCNFRNQNELIVGSGQYLFHFKLLKSSFEYSLSCQQHYRLRADLRSLEWSWIDKSSFYPKESRKVQQRVAQLVIADAEEGVSFYTYDQKSNSLKIRGFDIGIK